MGRLNGETRKSWGKDRDEEKLGNGKRRPIMAGKKGWEDEGKKMVEED